MGEGFFWGCENVLQLTVVLALHCSTLWNAKKNIESYTLNGWTACTVLKKGKRKLAKYQKTTTKPSPKHKKLKPQLHGKSKWQSEHSGPYEWQRTTKGGEFYLLQSRAIWTLKINIKAFIINDLLCLEMQVVAGFGIGTREETEPVPGQGRTSDEAHETCDKAERSHLKACLILQNQASRAFLRTLTHLWGYSTPHSIKQGMKICQAAGESFWILVWKLLTGQSILARLHGISRFWLKYPSF